MTDYRKFHNKIVAYATKDNPINIRIDTLLDLESPDESLFAIAQPTPPAKRITTIRMSDPVVRRLIMQKTEIVWPAVTKRPREASMSVDLVIGSDGRIKEARTYSPVENAIEDAVLAAVQKWTFAPQTANGIPAQIEAKLSIPFPDEFLGTIATPPEVKPIFDKMRAACDLRLDGAPSFHMKASFHSEDGATKGSYEETWMSPKQWRKEIKVNDASIVEVRTESAFYRTFPGKFAPRLADDIVDSLSFSLPGDNGSDFHDADWNAVSAKLGNLPMLRLSHGYISPEGKPDAFTDLYFVEEKAGFVRGRQHYSILTVLNDLQPFGEKTVARKITLLGGDVSKLEIVIDTLEPAANVSEGIFNISGAKPLYTSETEDRRFTQPRAVYTIKPSIPGWHGQANCSVKVDEHGHVRQVDVKGTTDESVVKAIRAALMNWEYEPATINGHPSLGFVQVNVE